MCRLLPGRVMHYSTRVLWEKWRGSRGAKGKLSLGHRMVVTSCIYTWLLTVGLEKNLARCLTSLE